MRIDSIRRRVLAEWRGLPDEPEKPDKCVSAGDALKKVLSRLGLAERLNEYEVQEAWRDIVGAFLAGHSAPESMRDGILTVRVLQPSVRYELDRSWKSEILHKLQARFGTKTVREVRFRS